MRNKGFSAIISGVLFFFFLFIFSEQFISGLNAGLLNCVGVVIPSLFPFLIASSLVGSGEMPETLRKAVEPVTQRLFRLPADCLPVIILGQLGGYLSGAKATQSLCESGILSREQSQKLLLFCINSGLGFSVNAVGNAMLGSREAGRILFLSLCIPSVFLGLFTVLLPSAHHEDARIKRKFPPLSVATVNGVCSATQATLNACGFICVFSGLTAVVDSFIKNDFLRFFISCILEVTGGCLSVSGIASLPVIAAVCAFGGICIHMQIFSLSKDFGVNIPLFYLFRLLHAALSFTVCKTILYLHPIETQVYASATQSIQIWSFSAPAAISLLFMCALLILDLDNNKKIC